MKPLVEYDFRSSPIVVAHRGSSVDAPENTLAAITRALEAGATMVEIDVQPTRDGRVVLFHDQVLGRTSDGSGRLATRTYEELQRLDVGAWKGEAYVGERIPLLDDALALLNGRAYVNIELKRQAGGATEEFLRIVLNAVERSGMAPFALLSSFDHPLLQIASTVAPHLPTAVILHPDDRGMPSERALPVGARGVVMSKGQISHERIADSHEHGLPVGVYTINTEAEVERMRRYGIDAYVTNDPALVGSLLAGGDATADGAGGTR